MTRFFGPTIMLAILSALGFEQTCDAQPLGRRQRGQPKDTTPEKKGPAIAAEEEEGKEKEPERMPGWPGGEANKVLFFQLDGYFRTHFRFFHDHNIGLSDIDQRVRAPFWERLIEHSQQQKCLARINRSFPGGSERNLEKDDCPHNTMAGAHMRFRLEPTLNVSEEVRIRSSVDFFDNLQLGSTPARIYGRTTSYPSSLMSPGQEPPIVSRNSKIPAVLFKRAWAEIEMPLFQLKFGRMPRHWGMGILFHDGRGLDANYGDTSDRIEISALIGYFRVTIAYDFAATSPSSQQILPKSRTSGFFVGGGQSVDIEELDDVPQISITLGRIDTPEMQRDILYRGDVLLNYGALLIWRGQSMDYPGVGLSDEPDADKDTREDLMANAMREITAHSYTIDIWAKFHYLRTHVEFEGILTFGQVEDMSLRDQTVKQSDILIWGLAIRARQALLRDYSLMIALELGMASGDDRELTDLNRFRALGTRNESPDAKITEFLFDPDYNVDRIFFREICGTVANAVYIKPSISYNLNEYFSVQLDGIYSLAQRKIAYPGNSNSLGFEADFQLAYNNHEQGFHARFVYAAFFPFSGLSRPSKIYQEGYAKDSATFTQTVQVMLAISF